jgi:hypothetical protein
MSKDKACASAASASVWGITAMAVVKRFPGIGKINSLKNLGFGISDFGF